MDTDGYTFPYVTGWAHDPNGAAPEQVVRDTGQRVLAAANTVLAATQPHAETDVVDVELAQHIAASTAATTDLRDRA